MLYGGLKTDTPKYVIELAWEQRRNCTEYEQLMFDIRTLRFLNNEVFSNIENIINQIGDALLSSERVKWKAKLYISERAKTTSGLMPLIETYHIKSPFGGFRGRVFPNFRHLIRRKYTSTNTPSAIR
jgi:hypothetical protein